MSRRARGPKPETRCPTRRSAITGRGNSSPTSGSTSMTTTAASPSTSSSSSTRARGMRPPTSSRRPRAERWPSRRWPRSRGPRRRRLATRTSTLVLACALVLLCAAPAGAVVGGHTASRETPWMGALEHKGDFVCGGSLLRPAWVLTAGHCVDIDEDGNVDPPADFRVLLGTKRRSSGGERIAVDQIVRHERYSGGQGGGGARYDVALLHLGHDTTLGAPIALAGDAERSRWAPGTEATALGWGTQMIGGDPTGVTAADDLQEVQVPIVSDPDCASSYGSDFDPLVMVCAGRLQGGADTCQGDSGGPLIVPGPLLVGSVSFGTGCGLATQYGVYGRVADRELRTWIEGHLPSQGAAPAPAGGSSPSSSSPPASTRLTLRLARVRPGARRVVVRVTASRAVHGVRVSLRRGRATVATRRLARLSGTRRVTLRARGPLRGATYRIAVTARDGANRAVTVRRSLRVRR